MKRKTKPKERRASHAARGRKPSQDGFSAKERLIFRYWNGSITVAADPMKLHRELVTFPDANMELDGKLVQTDTPETINAYGRLVKAVRCVFGIPEFQETAGKQVGLMDAECMALLTSFGQFQLALREATRPFATSPPTTGETPSAVELPIVSTADSTSTETEPSAAVPIA